MFPTSSVYTTCRNVREGALPSWLERIPIRSEQSALLSLLRVLGIWRGMAPGDCWRASSRAATPTKRTRLLSLGREIPSKGGLLSPIQLGNRLSLSTGQGRP